MNIDTSGLSWDAFWAEIMNILRIPFSGESMMSNYALSGLIMLAVIYVGVVFFGSFGKADYDAPVDFSEL